MKSFFITLCLCSLLYFAAPASSHAAGINAQQAASIARSHYPGRVIDIQRINRKDGRAFRVKILDEQGGMHIVIIDKKDGSVLSAH